MLHEAKVLLEMSKHYREQTIENPPSRWTLALGKDGYIIHPYYPSSELFRGQNKRFSPCLPSLFRGIDKVPHQMNLLTIEEQARLVVRQTKIHWFQKELSIHPILKWAKENNLSINLMALAQHYEIATGYIDVTQSFNVAAFFATCRKSVDGNWVSIPDGIGVIYKIECNKIDMELLEPVGLQPFPRPKEQWAWVLEIPMGHDFERDPAISFLEFTQDSHVSEYFLKQFNYGKSLFPNDPLADLAERVKQSESIFFGLLESVLNGFINLQGGIKIEDKENILKAISKITNVVDNDIVLLTNAEIEDIKLLWEAKKEEFITSTSLVPIFVRLEPVDN